MEIAIAFDGVIVTRRRTDFVVWRDRAAKDELILEAKARSAILDEDVEQCLLYLHQGSYRLCLLVNFGQKPLGVRRLVHTPRSRRSVRLSCLSRRFVRFVVHMLSGDAKDWQSSEGLPVLLLTLLLCPYGITTADLHGPSWFAPGS